MHSRALRVRCLLLIILLGLDPALKTESEAQQGPFSNAHRKYFVRLVDHRSLSEKALNLLGMTSQQVGRSFALVAGVNRYPNLPIGQRHLYPARADLINLVTYLRDFEYFDEIVVLENDAVTLDNFQYFLQVYFPDRLKQFPRSRFLFAYSGHGMQEGSRGYLLQASALSLTDKSHSISMEALRAFYGEVVDTAYHSLALINACHSGGFGRSSFGSPKLLPREPGAHVITAGGTKEVAWHIEAVGPGSVFFEKFFTALTGRADVYPERPDGTHGDGLVTVPELYSYLAEQVKLATDQGQNPLLSDFSRDGSLGSFFFLNRDRQARAGLVGSWPPKRKSMGAASDWSGESDKQTDSMSETELLEVLDELFNLTPKEDEILAPPPPKGEDPLQSSDLEVVNLEFRRREFSPDVYFEHNDWSLTDETRERLAKNAELLKISPQFMITLEGHASAEGSPEINLATGARRAEVVKDFLVSLGVSETRVRWITYGAERPICIENDLSCASLNRRVHMIITGRQVGLQATTDSPSTISFPSLSAGLPNLAKATLDMIALRKKQDPELVIRLIASYGDSRPTTASSEHLCIQRVEAVEEYLIARHGINPSHISKDLENVDPSGNNTMQDHGTVFVNCY